MTVQLEVTVGSGADWPVQCNNRGAQSAPTDWQSSDTITAYVYQGQSEALLFDLTTAWYTANGTQTGYGQAQVLLTITAVQSATLDPNGTYTVLVWRTPTGSSDPKNVGRATLAVESAAGTATQAIVPYCTLADLLRYAPWIKQVQDIDTDQEAFYTQRLEARQWMDWAILNNYRGAFVGNFETHSTLAFEFGYAGWRRSLGPSPSLITYLADNMLLIIASTGTRYQIIKACSCWAASLIGLAQLGNGSKLVQYGMAAQALAEWEMVGITAEVDLNGDGVGELFINLGSTNTLFT